MNTLFEILIPAYSREGELIDVSMHRQWDDKVMKIAGGSTILSPMKGRWQSKENGTVRETVLPVRIACDFDRMKKIALVTKEHYNQESVMYYVVSQSVFFV